MKTFLMIYDKNNKKLFDEYEERNDPQTTFNNWFLESDISYDLLKKLVAFFYIGSARKEDRKSGVIKFDPINGKLEFIESPLYFNYYEDGLNFIYYRHQKIMWDDNGNTYLLVPENSDDFDEDELFNLSIPLESLMPSMDAFLEVKKKYHFFISQKGRNILRVDSKPFKYKSFYKKCKVCGNITVLKIDDMLEGKKVNCLKCNVPVKTKITI